MVTALVADAPLHGLNPGLRPPNDLIRLVGQAEGLDVGGAGEGGANLRGNAIREIFFQQELHLWTAMS
jgi:hypothetical protein